MISLFFQDNVKLSPNLSINAGLRWEFRRPATDKHDNYVTLVPTGPKFSGPGNALLVTAAPDCTKRLLLHQFGLLVSDQQQRAAASSLPLLNVPSWDLPAAPRQTLIHPVHHDFAPRFGIVFRPTASDRLVVRSGYGLFYDLPNFNNQHFVDNNPVFSPSQHVLLPRGTGAPIATTRTHLPDQGRYPEADRPIHLSVRRAPLPGALFPAVESRRSKPTLSLDWAMDIAYIGTKGSKLGNLHLSGNQAEPGTTPSAVAPSLCRPWDHLCTPLQTGPPSITPSSSR